MYQNDFDVQNIAIDALMAIMERRMFEYTQLKKKLVKIKHFRDINSYELGGAFKNKSKARVHQAQSQEEINRALEELEGE